MKKVVKFVLTKQEDLLYRLHREKEIQMIQK